MDRNSILALVFSTLLAFLIRFLNVLLAWFAKILGVVPPTPIPTDEADAPQLTALAQRGTTGDQEAP